jgi:hypothetical protein
MAGELRGRSGDAFPMRELVERIFQPRVFFHFRKLSFSVLDRMDNLLKLQTWSSKLNCDQRG